VTREYDFQVHRRREGLAEEGRWGTAVPILLEGHTKQNMPFLCVDFCNWPDARQTDDR
jgi:hypothetical protein